MRPLQPLERFVAKRRRPTGCDLCSAPLPAAHEHVVDRVQRRLCCTCTACAILFRSPEAGARFRGVPERVLRDPALVVSRERWEALEVPVRLAFLFRNSTLERWVSVYPSPGGPTEQVLELAHPSEALGPSPLFDTLEDDVEALLFTGPRGAAELRCLLVPIDKCYELIALVRQHWRGFDGGDAREHIDAFFDDLAQRAAAVEEP